jgi:hypothetical protein
VRSRRLRYRAGVTGYFTRHGTGHYVWRWVIAAGIVQFLGFRAIRR